MTFSLKDTDEIFFSVHFLMPLGIPFHENMVSNHSIFFYFLASQTHRELALQEQNQLQFCQYESLLCHINHILPVQE